MVNLRKQIYDLRFVYLNWMGVGIGVRNDDACLYLQEYQRISDYIVNNPKNWKGDKFYDC